MSTTESMTGKVKFLVNKDGKRTHAVMPIKTYEELMEDIHDAAIVVERRKEGSISIAEMKTRLYESERVSG